LTLGGGEEPKILGRSAGVWDTGEERTKINAPGHERDFAEKISSVAGEPGELDTGKRDEVSGEWRGLHEREQPEKGEWSSGGKPRDTA